MLDPTGMWKMLGKFFLSCRQWLEFLIKDDCPGRCCSLIYRQNVIFAHLKLILSKGRKHSHKSKERVATTKVCQQDPAMQEKFRRCSATAPLSGGDFAVDGFEQLVFDVETKYPFMPKSVARRLVRAYGTDSWRILQKIASVNDLGTDFGAGVFAAELDWVVENEWVSSAEDFVWRRTRLGLRLSVEQIAVIDDYIRQRHSI